MKKFLLILPLTLLAAENNITQENNLTRENMELLYLKNGCSSCHGNYGEGIGATPRIQGQPKAVLLKRLRALKAGNPRTPFGGVMISFAQSLDENQTIEMAQYLSTLRPPEEEPERYYDYGDGSS